MSVINDAQQGVVARIVAGSAQRVLKVWHDPGFQAVLKREAWNFLSSVASEARAAWLRTGA